MLTFTRIAALPAFKPGIGYVVRGSLYLGMTNQCNALPLVDSRGPGFAMSAESGFSKLDEEPRPEQVAEFIDSLYADDTIRGDMGSMGEKSGGITFAGFGEPLLRCEAILETVSIIKEKRNGINFKLNTNGLFGADTVADLTGSGLVALGDEDTRRETLIQCISVALLCDNPNLYKELAQPESGKSFQDVCGFIASLSEAGANVECTAVEHPKVDLAATKKLAFALGASSFRVRTFHPKL